MVPKYLHKSENYLLFKINFTFKVGIEVQAVREMSYKSVLICSKVLHALAFSSQNVKVLCSYFDLRE